MVNLDTLEDQSGLYGFHERRSKPRIPCFYPAIVRTRSKGDPNLEFFAFLTDLSACGMYLLLERCLQPHSKIFILVRFTIALPQNLPAPKIAATGTVLRTEILPNGNYGSGIKLKQHRFL